MRSSNLVAISVMVVFGSSVNAGAVLVSTDKYMADKPSRILEMRKFCQGSLDKVKVESGKQTVLFSCVFDTSHTTGFNAVTQDAGVLADIHKIQSMDYTFEMMSVIHSAVKGCMRAGNVAPDNPWQNDEVAYCVAMRGYEYGKRFGRQYLAEARSTRTN